jgi:hypothetical protein
MASPLRSAIDLPRSVFRLTSFAAQFRVQFVLPAPYIFCDQLKRLGLVVRLNLRKD